MAIFNFDPDVHLLGQVREVDTRKVSVHVKTEEYLRRAKAGAIKKETPNYLG
mgnify:CR=1 FL=1